MHLVKTNPAIGRKILLLCLLAAVGLSGFCQTNYPTNIDTMPNRFFTQADFNNNFGKEMADAIDVCKGMAGDGFKEFALAKFDVDFTADTKEKLDSLAAFLTVHYGFTCEPPQKEENVWAMQCGGVALPYSEDNLRFWAIDLYCKGYAFDCRLNGYGALTDPTKLVFESLDSVTADSVLRQGIHALNNTNFGAAIIYFTTALRINPTMKTALQARGYCKDEIRCWKAARQDYDKALAIDPNYVDALLIRATNKDDAGEHAAALEDYNKIIALDPDNDLAYFNRGNTKFSLGDKNGACADWVKAKALGSPHAEGRLMMECK